MPYPYLLGNRKAVEALGVLARGPLLPPASQALAARALHRVHLPQPESAGGIFINYGQEPSRRLPKLRAALWCMALPTRQHLALLVASQYVVFFAVLALLLAFVPAAPSGCIVVALVVNRAVEFLLRETPVTMGGHWNLESQACGLSAVGILAAQRFLPTYRIDFAAYPPRSQLEATYRETLEDLQQCRADLVLPLVMNERGTAEAYCQLAAPIEYYETLCTACVFDRAFAARQDSWEYRQLRDASNAFTGALWSDRALDAVTFGPIAIAALALTIVPLGVHLQPQGVRAMYLVDLVALLSCVPWDLSTSYFYGAPRAQQWRAPVVPVVARAFPRAAAALAVYVVAALLGVVALFKAEPPIEAYSLEQGEHAYAGWWSWLFFLWAQTWSWVVLTGRGPDRPV